MATPNADPAQQLDDAQRQLRTALTVADEHGRQQYARSARDDAVEVLLDPRATAQQKAAARQCAAAAQLMTCERPSSRQRMIAAHIRADQSPVVEFD